MSESLENLLKNDLEDELDPNEFDIPEVELPTLESILKSSDEKSEYENPVPESVSELNSNYSESSNSTENISVQLDVLKSLETTSIASSDSRLNPYYKKPEAEVIHGPVLAFGEMTMISQYMRQSNDRINSGKPTALAISTLIAVGTMHGLVLTFDANQSVKHVLGSSAVGDKYGSVASLDFNTDCSRLLVGYARGQILMYDLTNGKLLRTITDAHPPGCAVLHVKFTDDPTLAVCNDSGGSVFELNFRRVMGIRSCESRCLFSGSRGEVCILQPLHFSKQIVDHPLRDRHILAMGTVTKVLVVTLRPQIKVLFTHFLKNVPGTVPIVSWQLRVFNQSDARTIDPVLMFARSDVVYFVRAKSLSWENIIFEHMLTMNLTYPLINATWLSSKTVLVLDRDEVVHAIDVDTQCELQYVSLENVKLVYNSSTFKSLATGGNVSKALADVGDHACYHSLVSWSGIAIILGLETVHVTRIRQWNERIDQALKSENGHRIALKIALTFYQGTAKAVIGLPAETDKRKELVSNKILDMLTQYVDLSMTKLVPDSGKLEILIEFFRDVVPVCVEYCIDINRVDVLCGRIYDRFRADSIAHGVFLECLQPYILDDRLKVLSPVLVKDFIEHFESKNMVSVIESCLVHLDMKNLDLNQIMNMCWSYGLYDAIFYIHNNVMQDYIAPMVELLLMLENAINSTTGLLSEKMMTLGNKLLVYISCCLVGAAYPSGTLSNEQATVVKIQAYDCLMCRSRTVLNFQFTTTYPILTILLKFSTQEFLNVLSLTFTESEFRGKDGVQKVQAVIDVLLVIMVENPGFTPDQVGSLFIFLARQVCCHDQDDSSLRVNYLLIQQIVEYLTSVDDDNDDLSKHEERQQALVELINCEVIGNGEDEIRLVNLVERAGFYQALRLLYTRQKRYDLIFETYLKEKARQKQAFSYIRSILQNDNDEYTPLTKDQMKNAVINHIKELIEIDNRSTVELITNVLRSSLKQITDKLKDEPRILYSFLRGLFEGNVKDEDSNSVSESIESDTVETTSPYLYENEVLELYLSLMCQCERNRVLPFLKSLETYKPQNSIDIVRRYHVDEATAFLVEESGDFAGAFNILHRILKDRFKEFIIKCRDLNDTEDSMNADDAVNECKSIFQNVVLLCQRCSSKLNESQREKLWFNLLDTAIDPIKSIKDLPKDEYSASMIKTTSRGLSQYVLNSMMGHMPLPAVMQKVIQNPSYDSGNFGEIKQLLLGMLDTYQYEKTLLNTTLNLLAHDRHQSLTNLHKAVIRGMAPRSQLCGICRKTILNRFSSTVGKNSIVVFNSGAVYHEACLKQEDILPSLDVPISPFASPKQTAHVKEDGPFMPAMNAVNTVNEIRAGKERQNYIDRKKVVSNGIKIFPNSKSRRTSPQNEQKVFRREGSLFAVPVQQSSSGEAFTKESHYRSMSFKTVDFDHKNFNLQLAAPLK